MRGAEFAGKHLLWLLLLAGCGGLPVETPQTVAAREEVLLSAPAAFGEILEGDEAVTWADRGTLLLTPTTLYFTSGGSRALSYAMVTDVSVQRLRDRIGLVQGRTRDSLLVVRLSRPVCGEACVFNLVDDPAAASRVAAIIEAQRRKVDPFGRLDGPGPTLVSVGTRSARAWWESQPAYLDAHARQSRNALDRWFCDRTDCRGGGRTAAVYGAAFAAALGEREGDWFRLLDPVTLNGRTEIDTADLLRVARESDPGVDRLIVSGLRSIALRERISAGYLVSIEARFQAFVDYFDLDPPKDGRYFWDDYTVTLPLDEWLAMDDAGFGALLRASARQVSSRVLADLGVNADATADP
ncbi:MAG: hypothetical protein R3E86_15860 [Pseudomonadales bacterium]